jgi:hypothetical protein
MRRETGRSSSKSDGRRRLFVIVAAGTGVFGWRSFLEEPAMMIEFNEESAASHPNFDTYLRESDTDGAVPLRFDRLVPASSSAEALAHAASVRLEQLAREEEADLLESTLVAARAPQGPGALRYRVLVVARKRMP